MKTNYTATQLHSYTAKKWLKWMGIFSFVVVILSSCKKEDKMNELSNNVLSNPKSGGTSAVPSYNDWDEFYSYYFPILNGDTVLEKSIQSKKSFVSMKSLFDEYLQAESEIVNFYDTLTDEGILALGIDPTRIVHSSEFMANAEAINVITDERDGTSWADIDIFDIHLGALTNDKGQMIVGKTLYQFGWDFIKYMPFNSNANFNEIVAANSTDATNNITVTGLGTKTANNANYWTGNWSRICDSLIIDGRTGIRITFRAAFISHPHHLNDARWHQLHFHSKVLKRRFWGTWYDLWPKNSNHSVSIGVYITNLTSNLFTNYSFWPTVVNNDKYPKNPPQFQKNDNTAHFILKPEVSSASFEDAYNALTYPPHVKISWANFKLNVIANRNNTQYDISCHCKHFEL